MEEVEPRLVGRGEQLEALHGVGEHVEVHGEREGAIHLPAEGVEVQFESLKVEDEIVRQLGYVLPLRYRRPPIRSRLTVPESV